MTQNKLCLSIDISHLSDQSRHLAPEHIGNSSGQNDSRSTKHHCGEKPLSNVKVDLDMPRDLVGNHVEYGTSVFAVGRAGLEFARTELARAGLHKEELDQLSTVHVAIQQATVPYVFSFPSQGDASSFSLALTHRARSLELDIHHDVSAHSVEYGERRADKQVDDTNGSQLPHEVVLSKTSRPSLKIVRLDLRLGSDYLRVHGWQALDSWRQAYAEGRYKNIFNENVRRLFRLDSNFCLKVPGAASFERLSTIAGGMLQEYLEGKDPKTCGRFPPGGKWGRANKKELTRTREEILAVFGIDIMIPWAEFPKQPPALLVAKLVYPGDIRPPLENAQLLFCRANWPKFLTAMREKYETTVAITAQQHQAIMGEISRG